MDSSFRWNGDLCDGLRNWLRASLGPGLRRDDGSYIGDAAPPRIIV